MNKKVLYTEGITKGDRVYFFDIEKNEDGDLSLTVSKSKRNGTTLENCSVNIVEEDLDEFVDKFKDSLFKLKELRKLVKDNPKYTIDKIREEYKNAYKPWTGEEDEELERLFCEGKKTKELADIFLRQEGAITSRIKKLELIEKYG